MHLADKAANIVNQGECRGFWCFNVGLVPLQYLQFCRFRCSFRWKWASSEKKMLKLVNLSSISLANCSLWARSWEFNSCTISILCGCKYKSLCRTRFKVLLGMFKMLDRFSVESPGCSRTDALTRTTFSGSHDVLGRPNHGWFIVEPVYLEFCTQFLDQLHQWSFIFMLSVVMRAQQNALCLPLNNAMALNSHGPILHFVTPAPGPTSPSLLEAATDLNV